MVESSLQDVHEAASQALLQVAHDGSHAEHPPLPSSPKPGWQLRHWSFPVPLAGSQVAQQSAHGTQYPLTRVNPSLQTIHSLRFGVRQISQVS